jgi:streptogramin lyase
VTLYQVGSGYGGAPTALSTSTTDASGKFLFGSFVCPSSNPQVYAVAVGGIPGSATPPSGTDSPIALMAALGPCTALPPTIVINELSTVASAYALAQFFNKAVTQHVPAIGAPSSNATGLANGATLITTNLVDIATGTAASFLSSGVNSPANIDSLANILAACVVSNSQLSSPCKQLFSATSISGFTTPVDTMQAVLNEALMPANSVSQLFSIQALNAPPLPYLPALSSTPPDWAIALNYTSGGLSGPRRIAIDGVGNAWVSDNTGSSVTELSPTGTALSPATGFTDSSISGPQGIAIDSAGNVWVPSLSSSNLTKLNSAGKVLSTVPALTGGLNMPSSVAIDQLGNAWVANSAGTGQGANSLSKFSSAAAALSPSNGFTGGGISSPNDVAIDASGNVWVANDIAPTGTISEFSASGSPVAGAPFSGGGLSDCFSVEIDGSGNVWVGNQNPSRLSKFTSTGTAISGSGGIKIGAQPGTKVAGIAIDSTGNVWTANFSGLSSNGVTEIDPTGTVALSGGSGLKELTSSPFGTAIDASGDLWVTNTAAPVNNSVTEYLGVTAPVKTPLIGPPGLP